MIWFRFLSPFIFHGGVFQGGFRLTVSLQGDLVHEPEERGRWRGMEGGWAELNTELKVVS